MVAPPARIQWIQFQELVVGENHPVYPDNDNRPLKQMIQFSNLSPQASDFPGFIGCYQGNEDPNGFQVGNVRNAFWNIATGILWMKQTGDNTNTGWVEIGGGDHLSGNGSPEGVASVAGDATPNGKFYDQQDVTSDTIGPDVDQPEWRASSWVKRNIPLGVTVAMEWFNGGNDTDIDTRVLDNGTTGITDSGTWAIHPITPAAQWDIVSSYGVPAADGYLMFNPPNLAIADYGTFIDGFTKPTATLTHLIGVGVRFDDAILNGYLATFDTVNYQMELHRVDAGVLTSIAGPISPISNSESAHNTPFRLECRVIGSLITVWHNGAQLLKATDATYSTQGVPVLYNDTAVAADVKLDHLGVKSYVYSDTVGWFSENGFEYNTDIMIGSGAIAAHYDSPKTGQTTSGQNIAIGWQAVATSSFAQSGGCIAIGAYTTANGRESVAIGYNAQAPADTSTALGSTALAYGTYSTAIGFSASADGTDSTAVGVSAEADAESSVALGDSARTTDVAFGAVALGPFTYVNSEDGVAVGQNAEVRSIGGIAIGGFALVDPTFDYGIAIGHDAAVTAANQLMFGADDGTVFVSEVLFNGGSGSGTRAPNFIFGNAALGTTDTDGFPYLPTCAGTPSGAATAYAGTVPIIIDTTASKIWIRVGGTWKFAALT